MKLNDHKKRRGQCPKNPEGNFAGSSGHYFINPARFFKMSQPPDLANSATVYSPKTDGKTEQKNAENDNPQMTDSENFGNN